MNDRFNRFKFRAWRKASKKMYNVKRIGFSDVDFETSMICVDATNNNIRGVFLESVDEYILMQCTGLKDKNGVLIYEGDICSNNNSELYQAFYYEQDAAIYLKSCDGGIMRVCSDVEVIGNIYENQELLEEKK